MKLREFTELFFARISFAGNLVSGDVNTKDKIVAMTGYQMCLAGNCKANMGQWSALNSQLLFLHSCCCSVLPVCRCWQVCVQAGRSDGEAAAGDAAARH